MIRCFLTAREGGARLAEQAPLPAGGDRQQLLELMGRDKKALGAGLTFVLDGPAGVEVVTGVAVDAATAALDVMVRR